MSPTGSSEALLSLYQTARRRVASRPITLQFLLVPQLSVLRLLQNHFFYWLWFVSCFSAVPLRGFKFVNYLFNYIFLQFFLYVCCNIFFTGVFFEFIFLCFFFSVFFKLVSKPLYVRLLLECFHTYFHPGLYFVIFSLQVFLCFFHCCFVSLCFVTYQFFYLLLLCFHFICDFFFFLFIARLFLFFIFSFDECCFSIYFSLHFPSSVYCH